MYILQFDWLQRIYLYLVFFFRKMVDCVTNSVCNCDYDCNFGCSFACTFDNYHKKINNWSWRAIGVRCRCMPKPLGPNFYLNCHIYGYIFTRAWENICTEDEIYVSPSCSCCFFFALRYFIAVHLITEHDPTSNEQNNYSFSEKVLRLSVICRVASAFVFCFDFTVFATHIKQAILLLNEICRSVK